MIRLCDTNVLVRVLTNDCAHKLYSNCVVYLNGSLFVRDYVLPEVVYQYLTYVRRLSAIHIAESLDEIDLFMQAPREYIAKTKMPSGWRKHAYVQFEIAWSSLCAQYKGIKLEHADLFNKTLQIAKDTGFDWVDCTLLAEHLLYGHSIASVDKDIAKGLKEYSVKAASTGVKPLSFM